LTTNTGMTMYRNWSKRLMKVRLMEPTSANRQNCS